MGSRSWDATRDTRGRRSIQWRTIPLQSTMGRLTTHVLDTARGQPAAGLAIELARHDGRDYRALCALVTNADGRCDAPLLEASALVAGRYPLSVPAGHYFAAPRLPL